MPRTALITGIAGQDGSLLAELLLERGDRVVGIDRRGIARESHALEPIRSRIELVDVDLCDPAAVKTTVESYRPSVIYHLASMSFIPDSWLHPVPVAQFGPVSTASILDAILATDRSIRFFHASSADMFGHSLDSPQCETTPIAPVTPYGAAKAFGHFLTGMYRDRFDLHASSGILFNHESSRRPLTFVTRKITHAAASISLGLGSQLQLGNLDAERDWSYAGDFVHAMTLIVDAAESDDYVLASGMTHTVRNVAEIAFDEVQLDWKDYVCVDETLARQNEVLRICGDPTRAETQLGWRRQVGFEDMIRQMVRADIALLDNASKPKS